jgi:hypothetical protein
MTADQIRELEAAYRAASARAEHARAERNEAIRQALATGTRPIDISRATGLTRARIAQLAPESHKRTTTQA